MPPAIKIENLSKQYRLGTVGTGTLSHDLKRWWTVNVLRREDPYLKIGETNDREHRGDSDYVWALRDINLEVEEGEVLGIIGKNGAGKSTLLKILSKVTTPTTGSIKARGRIASLLEVGTGFHPEMTGRENIFMNGAIMGMTKAEIKRKFDEIVDFAGVERYIDTPVKRYSSGMTVRLGFAVAAHLEPEILVVDEVLAVGDAEFQKKAIGKMQDVSRNQGRTVLFVSHNMAAVKSLCNRGLILRNGIIDTYGEIDNCVSTYLKGDNQLKNHKVCDSNSAYQNELIEIREVGIKSITKDYHEEMKLNEKLVLTTKIVKKVATEQVDLTYHIKDDQGIKLFSTSTAFNNTLTAKNSGVLELSVEFPANFFNWGTLYFDLYIVLNKRTILSVYEDIISCTIINKELELGAWLGREPGALLPNLEWTIL